MVLRAATKAVTKDEDKWEDFGQREVEKMRLRKKKKMKMKREVPGDDWEEGGGGGDGVVV